IWPESIAPWSVAIVPIGLDKSDSVRQHAESLYRSLRDSGAEVLLDDRDERPGVRFADMELIGIPHRIVLSERGIGKSTAEYYHRSSGQTRELSLDNLFGQILEIIGK
ncbi:MAG: proline--tRNA ligase, partial [Gammaproteobacteria bacterium]|nr:proline--tRNA ligase [Gammaproteobacteria bacterium]